MTKQIPATLQGIAIGTAVFFLVVFVMAAISTNADTSVVKDKITEAIRTSQIQYPGDIDENDKRGIDTWTDCYALEAALLEPERQPRAMFDTLVYFRQSLRTHPCDILVDSFAGRTDQPVIKFYSYHRYWWGAAILARIVLGFTSLSVGSYQSLMFGLSWFALFVFVLAFFLGNGRISLMFLPAFLSVGTGYGMFIFGQSIADAPIFIVGLLLLAVYSLTKVQQRSVRARAMFYSLLGSACVYFDILQATVVLVEILLCCQLIAPYADRVLRGKRNEWAKRPEPSLLTNIAANSVYVLVGGVLSIVLRLVGYAVVSDSKILDVTAEWGLSVVAPVLRYSRR